MAIKAYPAIGLESVKNLRDSAESILIVLTNALKRQLSKTMKVGVFYGHMYSNWFPAKVSLNTVLISYGNISFI